jgi:hypothetical protein
VVKEIYAAFEKAGVPEQDAWDAAAALCASEERFGNSTCVSQLEAEFRLRRWMIGVVIALNVGTLQQLLAS